MIEDARKLIEDLQNGKGFSFCTEDAAAIAFAMTPEDFTAFYSAASMNGYMISDLLIILIRKYIEANKMPVTEESAVCCDEINELFRMNAELERDVADLKDEVRIIRTMLLGKKG